METSGPVQPEDLAVTLAVRADLGAEHDAAVIGEFLDRVGGAIDARVDERLAARRQLPGLPAEHGDSRPHGLAFASIGMGIPITAIALSIPDGDAARIVAMLVAWGGIGLVNLAHTRRR
jgi:hypothetical protein